VQQAKRTTGRILAAAALLVLALAARFATAGGCGENAVLVVDPADRDSLYLANVYRDARRVPAANLLYMSPARGADYAEIVTRSVAAFLGELAARGIGDHVDFVVVMPTGSYRISARHLVTDDCANVNNFAVPFPFAAAHLSGDILGGLTSQEPNGYATTGDEARAFDSSVRWLGGVPSTATAARRYYVGALLGYTGGRGNTVEDLVALVARSAQADGTRPAGTFYYMQTGDVSRSGPRHDAYPAAVAAIEAAGGQAEHLLAVLPADRHDCLGIMTGAADPPFESTDFTVLPGAFCDHLTSWAATFDAQGQEKVSRWIELGASASVGAVEEPCNYPGKFPHAGMHYYVYQGLSLGEAWLRSAGYVPFQMLFYGDPLTRPFAHVPAVSVPDAPAGSVVAGFTVTPSATTTAPGASIDGFDLHLDGHLVDSTTPGGTLSANVRDLPDGPHDLTVLAYDDTLVRSVGRWHGTVIVANRGRAAIVSVSPASGDLSTPFAFTVSASGADVAEIRLVHNGRTVAATSAASGALTVHGQMLGAGPVEVVAVARFTDGRYARSAPVAVDVDFADGTPDGAAPVAFACSKVVATEGTSIVELPATFAEDPGTATFEVVEAPAQATILSGPTSGYRLLVPDAEAAGEDRLTFKVTTASGTSGEAEVRIVYGAEPLAPEATVVTELLKGKLADSTKEGKDKARAKGTWSPSALYPDPAFDPAANDVTISVAGVEVTIPAADPGWKTTRSGYKYKSPKGALPKFRLTVKTGKRAFDVRLKKLDFAAPPANPVRITIDAGGFRAERIADWTEKKPGRFKYP
jgi:hypothetical protein